MKNFTFLLTKSLLIILLTAFFSFSDIIAQTVEKPVLELVTVDHSDIKPILTWSVNEPSLITGYSIKRLIYEYPFVKPMSYQAIDTIYDPYIMTYKDETDVFGDAEPDQRLEKYFVVAFSIIGTDTFFNFSDKHQTMFLQSSNEYCEKRNKLIWNKYIGWADEFDKYEIYCKINSGTYSLIGSISSQTDTVFYHPNINSNSEYTYYIKALRTDAVESLSNESSVSSQSIDLPDFLNSDSVIVNNNNSVHLFFELDINSDVENYTLYKYNSQTSDYDSVMEHQGKDIRNIEFSDVNFEYNKINRYFLAGKDLCNDIVIVSDTMSNIFTEAEEANDEKKKNYIEWKDEQINSEYIIYRCIEDHCSVIEHTYDDSYTDDIQDVFQDQFINETTSGIFCYYVESSDVGYLSRSNIACVNQEEVYFLANAFNPNSKIEENRTFKPKIAFVSDYTLIIYGNFGNKIFETNDPDTGWDGTLPDGTLAPRASYLYFISFKSAKGIQVRKKSYINLVY